SLSGKRQESPAANDNPATPSSAQLQSDFSPAGKSALGEKSTIPQAEPAAQLPPDNRGSNEVWDSSEPTFVGNLSEAEALNLDLTRRAPADLGKNEAEAPSRPAPPPPSADPGQEALILPGMENVEENDKTILASGENTAKSKGKHRRSHRKSIPSWDDIVFGTKPR
ncbi:MAG: hypothetical protein E6167_08915, partial [Varibaculum cambriense]|nr:hypothetical protein [Varibaculum cambriense]